MRALIPALLGLTLTACGSSYNLMDAKPSELNVPLAMSVGQVLDGFVAITHDLGYEIGIIDKDAGLLDLDPIKVSAAELQRYCEFPALDDDGTAASSFAQYNAERIKDGLQGVSGHVNPNILVKQGLTETSSIVSLKTSWEVTNGEKTVDCNSLGVWEQELISRLREVLLTPNAMPVAPASGT